MTAIDVNLRKFGMETTSSEKVVLTARPEIRIVKLSFLAPALVLSAGIIGYLLPLPINPDFQLAGSFVIAGIGLIGITCLLILYEGLSNAVYRLTNEHIEEEYGLLHKRLRCIPLSYVRDVTYDQNFIQGMLGVSSVSVSPTNGNKIVLSNIRYGDETRETIWKLVLSNSPGTRTATRLDPDRRLSP